MVGIKSAADNIWKGGKAPLAEYPRILNLRNRGIQGNDPNKDSLVVNPSFSMVPGYYHVIKSPFLPNISTRIMDLNGTALVRMVSILNLIMVPKTLYEIMSQRNHFYR